MRAAGKVVTFSNANLSLDGATGTGQLSVDTSPARPYIKGALKLSELDLNKYIGSDGISAARPTPITCGTCSAGGAPADAIGDLSKSNPPRPAPRSKGSRSARASGWSEGQIDASALGLADADVKLTLGKLLVKDIKVGQSQLTVALKNAVMKTTFDDVQLYGGRGKGFVTLDAATAKVVAIGTNLTLDGIAAQPLLKDAAGMELLAGNGRMTLAVSGQGQSQKQIIETLTGKADLAIANGAIVGWNIPGMVRGISQGKLSGLDRQPAEKTDFSEMTSTLDHHQRAGAEPGSPPRQSAVARRRRRQRHAAGARGRLHRCARRSSRASKDRVPPDSPRGWKFRSKSRAAGTSRSSSRMPPAFSKIRIRRSKR